jgi:chemotaxis protein methyltransferase CheR
VFEFNIQRLTAEEFQKFAKLIYDESGIFMKDTKITLLSNRLRKRLGALNLESFSDYYTYLVSLKDKSAELDELLDVVSTNETYFFRNERHFDALMQKCLPHIARTKKEKKLTIWSAGCSTGEEPYTIAVCLQECRHLFPGWEMKILATDIAHSVLKYARTARYGGRRIDKVPADYLAKYFTRIEDVEPLYEVKPDVRNMVQFSILNLFKDPFPKGVDIIFCRNVMIYFDREHQKILVKNFFNSLNKEWGYFFIGHSETLHSVSEEFAYMKILDAPVYVPKERLNELPSD